MLIRGAIQDRLWGKTLGALGRRAVTGQLTISSGSERYAIVFDHGHVVAAAAPGSTFTLLGVALAQGMLAPQQIMELELLPPDDRELALANVFPSDVLLRLRRQAIAGAVTRTFTLREGDFGFAPEVELPLSPNTAMHIGGLIFHGVLAHVGDEQLGAAIQELGTAFRVIAEGIVDLPYFGFGEPELAIVQALDAGLTRAQLDALPSDERRRARATIYTLASLGALTCEAPSTPPRVARGTVEPAGPGIARTRSGGLPPRSSSPSIPASPTPAAFERAASSSTSIPRQTDDAPGLLKKGQAALRDDRLEDAVLALTRATELAPDDLEARAALAWAKFCAATNKPAAADATRQVLAQVAHKHERPVLAHYYLGMVERMIGRTAAALAHFHQVLELDPAHREATTELRFLTRSSPKR